MNRCPIVSTPEFPAECIKQDCALWDKSRHICAIFTIARELEELWRALDNHSRSINQAVLMKPKVETYQIEDCPKCGGAMNYHEAYRICSACGYSDPYK